MADNRAKLLRRVQIACFAAHEAKLYLDSHPGDTEAYAYFRRWTDTAAEATASYEAAYGPLTAEASNTDWDWVSGPWPWDYEANA